MSYLITINKAGTTILRPECITLCPELAFLSGQEMLCVILAYDYFSLYRQFPEDARQHRARIHVFKGEREGIFKEPKIIKAVSMYRSLQYDHRREEIIVYNRKLANVTKTLELHDDNDHKGTKDLLATSKELRKAISDLEDELNKEEESGATETDDKLKLSFLERLTSNKEKFLAVTKPKK
jgi:hypothetical protein